MGAVDVSGSVVECCTKTYGGNQVQARLRLILCVCPALSTVHWVCCFLSLPCTIWTVANGTVIVNGQAVDLPLNLKTIADFLEEDGWETAAFGKWDIGCVGVFLQLFFLFARDV